MANKFNLPLCDEFEKWLYEQGYDEATVRNRISNVAKIDDAYGNLLDHWKNDGLQSVMDDLSYTGKDAQNCKPNPSKIAIDGNIYNGLATYRSALKLYIAFLTANPHLAGRHSTTVETAIANAVDAIKPTIENIDLSGKGAVNNHIIDPMVKILNNSLASLGYTFKPELKANDVDPNSSGQTQTTPRDRYDIVGQCANGPLIIIEVDTHRSDQVAKKVVSRIALNPDKELIYVSVLYPNNHVSKAAEIQECIKYVNFISILFSLFDEPKKQYLNFLLF